MRPAEPILPVFAPPFTGPSVPNAEQLAADAASRKAYEHVKREAAIALAEAAFDVERPAWIAPAVNPGRVSRYLSLLSAAEERVGGTIGVAQSSVPLEVNGSGLAPTSLKLAEANGYYVPGNPIVPIVIHKGYETAEAKLPQEPGTVPIDVGASGSHEESALVGNRVFFANIAPDTDFMIEPLPEGAEFSWQLASEKSPQDNELRFELPAGAALQLAPCIRVPPKWSLKVKRFC